MLIASLLLSMLVSTDWVDQHRGDPLTVIVEVGNRADYDAGHIPGAVNIPWTANLVSEEPPVLRSAAELQQIYAKAGVTRDAIVIAYCRTGMEASMTYFVLRYIGYDVSLYDGSFIEWSGASGTAVARAEAAP